ncbi:hypothetical protein QUF76_03350 [Desulfobacterales bacterium HSG16]|nr:hypothetical protein [Desulfobacterales bacterium HSG16]
MNIALTPEIEQVLGDIAEKQGTTIELLALKTLQERFFSKREKNFKRTLKQQVEPKTLADLLVGYIGRIDSSEIVNGGVSTRPIIF